MPGYMELLQAHYNYKKDFWKALLNLPLVWVERGEPHEEESEDEEDEDQPPECVNHTHGQRDGQGAHKQI